MKVNWFEVDIDFISFEVLRYSYEPLKEFRDSLGKLTGFTRDKWHHIVNKIITGDLQPDEFYQGE